MYKAETVEHLYLDFDGFFASVMQQINPSLRGRPVGVIPANIQDTSRTTVIACSKEAKARGCKNVMRVPDALKICPDMVLAPQMPDMFRRAHNALISEIACEIPIDTIKSIDELACRLDPRVIANPNELADRIKQRIKTNIGPYITCSIGFAGNRMLAKIACKMDKPNGTTIWHPKDMPAPLLGLHFDDVPGIGNRMQRRLWKAGISDIEGLLNTQSKQLRALWKSVTGERMWYALHGYDVYAMPTERGMYGHGRVLPPDCRKLSQTYECSRMLLTKAARRMRRDGFYARYLSLYLSMGKGKRYANDTTLRSVNDEHSILSALKSLWHRAREHLPRKPYFMQVHVMLGDLTPSTGRQLDLFSDDDEECQRWEKITGTIDGLNTKFGKRVVTLGPWTKAGHFAGGKIAFTRIPEAEDFI